MPPSPLPPLGNPASILRETCARITETPASPLLAAILHLLARILLRLADIADLWHAGLLPPPNPRLRRPNLPRQPDLPCRNARCGHAPRRRTPARRNPAATSLRETAAAPVCVTPPPRARHRTAAPKPRLAAPAPDIPAPGIP